MARKNWLHARRTLHIDRIKLTFSDSLIQSTERRRMSTSDECNATLISELLSTTVVDSNKHRQRANEWSLTFSKVSKLKMVGDILEKMYDRDFEAAVSLLHPI
uniref:Uncharacterized protein n=1 Tax=Plectus sambesii TaxID=2011161 RepID=A0A914XCS2_9BILA